LREKSNQAKMLRRKETEIEIVNDNSSIYRSIFRELRKVVKKHKKDIQKKCEEKVRKYNLSMDEMKKRVNDVLNNEEDN
jgi:hypothetical protein